MTTPSNTHPAAVEINGVQYLHDAQGNLVPLANIKAVHLLEDELVRKIVGFGESLSAELARYSMHTDADIAAFDALRAQEYGVEPRETKGNRTFSTYDGLLKVQVAVASRIRMGSSLEEAKAVLDAMIVERGAGVDPFLITLVKRAFKTDQEGKVDVRAILALRRLDVDDPRWPKFCQAIDEAIIPDGSKRYTRLYRRNNQQAGWQMIPLALSDVQPSPAALEHPSLRRQAEEYGAAMADLWAALDAVHNSAIKSTYVDAVEAVRDLVDQINLIEAHVRTIDYLDLETLTTADAVGLAVATLNRHIDAGAGQLLDKYVQQHPEDDQNAAQVEIGEIKAVLARVQGLPEGITVAGAVEWLVDSIGGLHGWLEGAAEDGEHIAASQVLLSLPEIAPRKLNTAAE